MCAAVRGWRVSEEPKRQGVGGTVALPSSPQSLPGSQPSPDHAVDTPHSTTSVDFNVSTYLLRTAEKKKSDAAKPDVLSADTATAECLQSSHVRS